MNFIVPKELHQKYGYNTKLAKGKWFNIDGIDFKLLYIRESKKFRSCATKIEKIERKAKADPQYQASDEYLKSYSEIIVGGVITDWKLKVKKDGKEVIADLNANTFFEFIKIYGDILDQILKIFVDNKRFLSIDTKKSKASLKQV